MNKLTRIFTYVAFAFVFCCTAIGYASVQDTLHIGGSVSASADNTVYCYATTAVEGADTTVLRIYQRKGAVPKVGETFDDDGGEGANAPYTVLGVYSWPYGTPEDCAVPTKDGVALPSWRSSADIYTAITDVRVVSTVVDGEEMKVAPESLNSWFRGFTNCNSFDLVKLDTKNSKSMYYMFQGCTSLRNSSFVTKLTVDTTSATTLESMFNGCKNLNAAIGGALDNVTFMYSGDTQPVLSNLRSMFNGCHSLVSVDLSGIRFSTSKALNLQHLFTDNSLLQTVLFPSAPISNFGESGTDYMFSICRSLKTLDLRFIAGDVRKALSMFQQCKSLETIVVGPQFVASVANGNTFFGTGDDLLNNLEGGSGTRWEDLYGEGTAEEKASAESSVRAVIDGRGGKAGYLTCIVHPVIDDSLPNVTWDFSNETGKTSFAPNTKSYLKLSGEGVPTEVVLVSSNGTTSQSIPVTNGIIEIDAELMEELTVLTIRAANS